MNSGGPDNELQASKTERKLRRALERAESRLADSERIIDQTQHLLNTRIGELEQARADLQARTDDLVDSERRFHVLADAAFEAILVLDGTTIRDINDAATQLYGFDREAMIGQDFTERVVENGQGRLAKHLAMPDDAPFETHHLNAEGLPIPVEVRIRTLAPEGGGQHMVAVRDITQFKAMEAKLRHLAATDPLTGIANRRAFMEMGQNEYFRAVRYGQPCSVLMLDVDHFKRINDTYGHDVGDVALKELTGLCSEALRASDLIGRLGGEEFAIALPSTDCNGGEILADRLRERIAAHEIAFDGGTLQMTVSIGLACFDAEDGGIEQMLHRADQALYAAKQSGRNRVVTA